jgi:hypothetical protein
MKMDKEKYDNAADVIKEAKIPVGDKLILSSVLFRAEALEKENAELKNRINKVLDQCAVSWINEVLKGKEPPRISIN